MKRALVYVVGLLLTSGIARAELRGDWEMRLERGNRVHLELERRHSNTGQTMELSAFSGLDASRLRGDSAAPVSFALRREAGAISFTGTMRGGKGYGEFVFNANPEYLAALERMGVDVDRGHQRGSTEEHLMSLAVLDVSSDYIRSLQAEGYRESLDDYLSMRIFNVTPELIREFRALGMELDADDLITSQIHGVKPEYVREMRARHDGRLSFDDLVSTRIHGATPEFIAEMSELGYGDLDLDDYVAFRIHGVTPRFVEELAELGYRDVSADDLVAFRIHGVTPSFIRDLADDGYDHLDPDDLVDLRIHGRHR